MEYINPCNSKFVVNLESERLLLRNILPQDKDFIVSLWTDPEVTKYLGGPREKEQMLRGIQYNIENPYQDEYDLWVLVNKSDGKPVGHCGLLKKEVEGITEVEVIYVIGRRFWGLGYATEAAGMLIDFAFNEKKLGSVIALIKPRNKASEKVAAVAGLKFEKEVTRQENKKMSMFRIKND